jgi:hypothetical protein
VTEEPGVEADKFRVAEIVAEKACHDRPNVSHVAGDQNSRPSISPRRTPDFPRHFYQRRQTRKLSLVTSTQLLEPVIGQVLDVLSLPPYHTSTSM